MVALWIAATLRWSKTRVEFVSVGRGAGRMGSEEGECYLSKRLRNWPGWR